MLKVWTWINVYKACLGGNLAIGVSFPVWLIYPSGVSQDETPPSPSRSIKRNMKKLLFSVTKKDFTMQTFRSGGPGGQNQNKVNSGVRLVHKDSGAVGEARDTRYQLQNKKSAFSRLVKSPKFQAWLKIETARSLGTYSDIEKKVDGMMGSENLLIECFQGG